MQNTILEVMIFVIACMVLIISWYNKKKAEQALNRRHKALESIYAIATTFSSSKESTYNQIVLSIASILEAPFTAIGKISGERFVTIANHGNGELKHAGTMMMEGSPCSTVFSRKRAYQCSGKIKEIYPGGGCLKNGVISSYLGVPVINSHDEIVGIICILDTKEHIYSEEQIQLVEIFALYTANEFERESMLKELVQSREMRILGQLTSGVAHEVRNPLNAIWAITEALFQEISDNSGISIYKEHIRAQVDHLTRLMQGLLDFGKPCTQAMNQFVLVRQLCSQTVDFWNESNSQSEIAARLELKTEDDPVRIRGDFDRLQQVIVNLLDNASQHSLAGSEIRVKMEGANRGRCRICIIDSGTGISPENMGRLFEPFFTTRKKGTGLGLSIVKNIVEVHNGEIHVWNNDPPPGISVEISFPEITESNSSTRYQDESQEIEDVKA